MFKAVAQSIGRRAVSRVASVRQFSSGNGRIMVLADHNNQTLNAATRNAVAAATQLGDDVTVVVAGYNCGAVAEEAAKVSGVKGVMLVEKESLEHQLAENMSAMCVAVQAQESFEHIVVANTAVAKGVFPRLAAAIDVSPISEVIGITSKDTFIRPIYAGNAIATVQSSDATKIISIRPTNFEACETEAASAAPIDDKSAALTWEDGSVTWVEDALTKSDRPSLTASKVVISGGRGMQNGENFGMLETLADKLGGAVGASRAAVDAGFCPNDMQIGQTGKVIAPDLYIAFGVSGAIQHLAGMKDSKTIAAVNKDPDAAIFQVADYGLVGDLFDVLPAMNEKL